MVFWCFQELGKGYIGNEWVKEIFYWLLPHLSLHWLIMRVGFEIKGSKLKSSVNSFKFSVLCFDCLVNFITSWMRNLFIRFFIFIFIILVCNYLCRLFGKFRNNIEQTMVKIGWFQVESALLGTLNLMQASLLGIFLSNFFSASYFVFKVTSLCFLFVVIVKTIHKQFPELLHFCTATFCYWWFILKKRDLALTVTLNLTLRWVTKVQ